MKIIGLYPKNRRHMPTTKTTKRPAGQPKKTQASAPARRGGVKKYQPNNSYQPSTFDLAEFKADVKSKSRKLYSGKELSVAIVLAVSLTVNVALIIALVV